VIRADLSSFKRVLGPIAAERTSVLDDGVRSACREFGRGLGTRASEYNSTQSIEQGFVETPDRDWLSQPVTSPDLLVSGVRPAISLNFLLELR